MKSLYIATPMFGGQCYGGYTASLIEFTAELNRCGVTHRCNFLYNESLINRARNNLVASFMASEFTHLLFIDADISFKASEVMDLLEYDLPILAGIYPKKKLDWQAIKNSIENKETSNVVVNRGLEYVGTIIEGNQIILRDRSVPLKKFFYAGTGFMLISREAFDKLIPFVEQYRNHFDKDEELTYNFFNIIIDPETHMLLSEDYYFCQICREHDIPIYVATWLELNHTGTYTFGLQ
jgi:hypothetical protein